MKLDIKAFFSILQPAQIVLPKFSVITGKNGSGKTLLIKSIDYISGGYYNEYGEANTLSVKLESHDYNLSVIYVPPGIILNNYNTYDEKISNLKSFWQVVEPICHNIDRNLNLNEELNIDRINQLYKQKIIVALSGGYSYPTHAHLVKDITVGELQIIKDLCLKTGKEPYRLTFTDYLAFYQNDRDIMSKDINIVFHQYLLSQKYNYENVDKSYDPLVKFNDVLHLMHFKYNCTYSLLPDDGEVDRIYFNDEKGNIIDEDRLSSGEKTVLSLAIIVFNATIGTRHPDVLALDEPDAHLHPILVKDFIDIIEERLINDLGINVIITTHSPTTVALSPDDSIFVMEKGLISNGVKNKAIQSLTEGLLTLNVVHEHRKQIFTEDNVDQVFFEELFEKLTALNLLNKDLLLLFISVGHRVESLKDQFEQKKKVDTNGIDEDVVQNEGNGGCTIVKEFTRRIYKEGKGNPNIFGIIDWDNINTNDGNDHIIILGKNKRHSLDNYLYDPLFIACYCAITPDTQYRSSVALDKHEDLTAIKEFPQEKLQNICDTVFGTIKPLVQKESGFYNSDILVDVKLYNGITLRYPEWFLRSRGHDIGKACYHSFHFFKSAKTTKSFITTAVVANYWFLPEEIIEMFRELQSMPISY